MSETMAGVPGRMRAAVLYEPHRIEIEERATPSPGPGDVLVEVSLVGVCGSDVHYFDHGRIGDFVVRSPLVLGHEVAGRVVGVGDGVDPRRLGERVAVEPGRSCGHCAQCLAGHYNLCPSMKFFGTPPVDGALCDYVTVSTHLAFAVPDVLSDESAALLEPLSVALWATAKAGVTAGSSLLIAGAGPIGLVMTQMGRAVGASRITITDISPERLDIAAFFGATETALAGSEGLEGFDAFIDCSGAPSAIGSGVRAVRPAGVVVLVGMGPDELSLPFGVIQRRELTVTGTFRYSTTWPRAIALAAHRQVDLDSLVTGRFALEQTADALRAGTGSGAIKAVVEV